MVTENPISNVYDYYVALVNGSTIKYSIEADAGDTLVVKQYVDEYLDAYYKKDEYIIYNYSEDEFIAVGVTDPHQIVAYQKDKTTVPVGLQVLLLENRRNYIVTTFDEPNNYYRNLNGYPPVGDTDFIYVDETTAALYGIDPTIPIHLIEDKLGTSIINLLESVGYINTLISKYPDKTYLKYLGSYRVRVIEARAAYNFSLLKLVADVPDNVREKFIVLYEQSRLYYISSLYIIDYRNIIDHYDNFIGLCIMVMALEQLTARSIISSIERDFFDVNSTKALYNAYGLTYYSKLDENIQLSLAQNLNMLIKNKGTNKVLFDIATLLGFTRIDIFKYYLMKEHIMDENGNPLFIKKIVYNEDTGEYEEVYDYEKMYDIYFKKVQVNNYDYYEVLEDEGNRVSYDSLTANDPFWIDDEILYKEIWEREYNYKETKYLGVTTSYKLSELVYDSLLLIRMVFDKKEEIDDITLKLPSITGNTEVKLFDTIVLLCALTSKKYNLTGEIISKPSQTIFALENIEILNNNRVSNEVASFDFKYLTTSEFISTRDKLYKYMTESEIQLFESYVGIITVTGVTGSEKAAAFNAMYANIKNLSILLTDGMVYANTAEEYRLYRSMYNALYYTRETDSMFKITLEDGTESTADTFLQYLEYTNAELKEFVDNVSQDDAFNYVDHIISRLESLLYSVENLHILNNSTSTIQDVLIDLIRFFKSYTTEMIGLNVVYIFDFKVDNLLKFTDELVVKQKSLLIKDYLQFGYSDNIAKLVTSLNTSDNLKLKDDIMIRSFISGLEDELKLRDDIELMKNISAKELCILFDAVSVNSSVEIESEHVKLRDTIYRLATKLELVDSILLKDDVGHTVKSIQTGDKTELFDDIGYMKKEIPISDTSKFRDTCIVIRK